MKKSFLLAYSDTLGSRDRVKEFLEAMPEIIHWRYDMDNSFYIVSEKSAKELAQEIRIRSGESGRFIIVELETYFGWLTNESWYLIKEKNYKPKV